MTTTSSFKSVLAALASLVAALFGTSVALIAASWVVS
jgi:hypothetical protein